MRSGVKYRIDNLRVLAIDGAAEETFGRFAPASQKEAGGIILGRVFSNEVLIERATTPTRRDKAARYWFQRSVPAAQERVTAAWRESGGTLIYLGEWHTHPEAYPTPSSTDRGLIANMLRDSKMEIDFLFLVINGTKGRWVGMQTRTGLVQLDEIDQGATADDTKNI
jgi:integrative and conjugative element protein (TIGR02256 family)